MNHTEPSKIVRRTWYSHAPVTFLVSAQQLHDYLDRSGEVFEYGNDMPGNSLPGHGWTSQPVPDGILFAIGINL